MSRSSSQLRYTSVTISAERILIVDFTFLALPEAQRLVASRSGYRCCRHDQTKILVISNSGGTCLSQVCIALSVQLSLTLQESSSYTHDTLTVRPDLKVSLYTHGANCRQKSRTVVGLLTSRHSEGAMPVITKAEEDSVALPSDPRILIADASPSVHTSTLP